MHHWQQKYPQRFDLDTDKDYKPWREEKLASYPQSLDDIVVELADMTRLSHTEKTAILERIERANMCVYTAGNAPIDMASLLALGKQLGVSKTDKEKRHKNADQLTDSKILKKAIPFTTRHVNWHTDGTYFGSNQTIQALFLLCKQPALQGGSNKLLDPEILYIQARDQQPDALRILMETDCFNYKNPKSGEVKPELGGKVFWVNRQGYLNHRFSFRKMDMDWPQQADIQHAKTFIEKLIRQQAEFVIEGTLETGTGLVSNNVLHTREKLIDSEQAEKKRMLLRVRYYDRVNPNSA